MSEYVKRDGWLETSERVCDWLVCMVCSVSDWCDWIERVLLGWLVRVRLVRWARVVR